MCLAKTLLHFALKGRRALVGIVFTATSPVGEMTLALDVTVLKAVGPGADLTRTRLGKRDERRDLRFQI